MSAGRSSSTVHREDGGLVYSSIRNDGTMIHWCDKCNRMWVSAEKPEREVSKRDSVRPEIKFKEYDMNEARDYLQRFKTSKP